MALTNPFDTSTPAGSDDPKAGDNRIRELKDAIVERESQDHYWPATGTVYDDDDTGFHKQVTLLEQGSAPASKSNAGRLYTKDDGGDTELYYKDDSGNEIQLTEDGALKESAAELASNDIIMTTNSSKTGWTEITATYANRYIRVGSTGLATGGSATHTHSAGTYTVPAHNHGGWTEGVSFSGSSGSLTAGGLDTLHRHPINTEAAATITGSSGTNDNDPLYVDVRLFQKD